VDVDVDFDCDVEMVFVFVAVSDRLALRVCRAGDYHGRQLQWVFISSSRDRFEQSLFAGVNGSR
jgi:hypothetical protein